MIQEVRWGRVTDSQPVLISGAYRSGTTFLASLIGAHRDFEAGSSTVKFLRFCLGRYGNLDDPINRKTLVEDVAARLSTRWQIELDSKKILADSEGSSGSYAHLYDAIMRQHLLSGQSGALRWLDKMNLGWSHIPDFLDMFPMGRVVHVIRDPRDVLASYKHMTFEIDNTYLDAAFNCRGSMELESELSRAVKPRVLIVRLEDFQSRREELLCEIEDFLMVDPDPSLRNPLTFRAKGEDWMVNTSFEASHIGWPEGSPRWPKYLSRPEIFLVELITHPWLRRYGYAPHVTSPSPEDWNGMYSLLNDSFLKSRFSEWLETGKGVEGYRTDPYEHEMKLVFPERFATSGAK